MALHIRIQHREYTVEAAGSGLETAFIPVTPDGRISVPLQNAPRPWGRVVWGFGCRARGWGLRVEG